MIHKTKNYICKKNMLLCSTLSYNMANNTLHRREIKKMAILTNDKANIDRLL
jgi:hypothetical protein